jgi:hypothetical protein
MKLMHSVKTLARTAAMGGMLVALAACNDVKLHPAHPEVDFSNKAPIRLDVGSIEVTDGYKAVDAPNRIEKKFPHVPAGQLRKWANERIQAAGGENRLVIVIEDASATETPLDTKGGITGAFTKQPNARVDAVAKVSVKLYTPQANLPKVEANAHARGSRTIQEDSTVYEREKLLNDMTLKLVNDIDAEIEKQINAYFNNYRAY